MGLPKLFPIIRSFGGLPGNSLKHTDAFGKSIVLLGHNGGRKHPDGAISIP